MGYKVNNEVRPGPEGEALRRLIERFIETAERYRVASELLFDGPIELTMDMVVARTELQAVLAPLSGTVDEKENEHGSTRSVMPATVSEVREIQLQQHDERALGSAVQAEQDGRSEGRETVQGLTAAGPVDASGEPDRFAPCNSSDPMEHFWTAVLRGWDIEPREYFEREAVPMGFRSPVEMAVHHMWKRHAKDWPAAAAPSPSAGAAKESK